MANYQSLKTAINAVIKANGNKEITGTVLNEVLLAMVNSLGAGYQFAGVATPSTTPGTPDQKVFYIASQAGTYTNFNGAVVSDGIAIFEWNGTWTTEMLDLPVLEQVQSDWTETDTTKKSYIKHKPNIPPSANVDPVPTKDSQNAVSSGGTFDMIQDATNVNAIESVDGKIYNDYQAGDIFFIVDNNVRKYRVALVAGTADAEHPVTISPVNFYYALNSADAINLSLTLKTVSTEQQSLSSQQKEQAAQNIGLDVVVKGDVQQSLSDAQKVQAQNNMMGKAYVPSQNSGLGKVYLAKNNGVLTQSMMQAVNTVYVIQYDYTLAADITIPAGCTLEFDGGSISGAYTINNVCMGNNPDYPVFLGCEVSIVSKTVKVLWFGADKDNNAAPAIQRAVRACNNGSVLYFTPGHTYIHGDGTNPDYQYGQDGKIIADKTNNPVYIGTDNRYVFSNLNNLTIAGNSAKIQSHQDNTCIVHNSMFVFDGCNNLVIESLSVDGNKNNRQPHGGDPNGYNEQNNLRIDNCTNVLVNNCSIDNSVMDGIMVDHTTDIRIVNTNITNSYRNNITFEIVVNGFVANCVITSAGRTYGTAPMDGIDLENDWGASYDGQKNIKITNCIFKNNYSKDVQIVGPNLEDVEVSNCSLTSLIKCNDENVGSNRNLKISNNVFLNSGILGLINGSMVEGNVFNNAYFDLRNSGDSVFKNNVITKINSTNAYFYNCIIKNNQFKDFAVDYFSIVDCTFEDNEFEYSEDGCDSINNLGLTRPPLNTVYTRGALINSISFNFQSSEDSVTQSVIDTLKTNVYNSYLNTRQKRFGVLSGVVISQSDEYIKVSIPAVHLKTLGNINFDIYSRKSGSVLRGEGTVIYRIIAKDNWTTPYEVDINSLHSDLNLIPANTSVVENDNIVFYFKIARRDTANIINPFAIFCMGENISSYTSVIGVNTVPSGLTFNLYPTEGSVRPTNPPVGFSFFDTNTGIEKPLWYKGNDVWVDAAGAVVPIPQN